MSKQLFDGLPSDDDHTNEILDIISNQRRRYVLSLCDQSDEPLSLSDLAEEVAALEQEKERDALTSAERKTVYTSLQQTHIPRLERAGMIEVEDGEITVTDDVNSISVYIDIVPENSISWGTYYLGLSIISTVVVGGLWADLFPSEPAHVLVYFSVIVAVFLISSLYHTYQANEIDI